MPAELVPRTVNGSTTARLRSNETPEQNDNGRCCSTTRLVLERSPEEVENRLVSWDSWNLYLESLTERRLMAKKNE
jgi:hypothetical protein